MAKPQATLEELYALAQTDLAAPTGAVALKWAFLHARAVGILRSHEHTVRRQEHEAFDGRVKGEHAAADGWASMVRATQVFVEEQAAIVQACANVMELASRGVKLEAKQNTRSSAPQQPKRAA